MRNRKFALMVLAALAAAFALPITAHAQDACPNRGMLDTIYCDANNDMVADTPADPAKQRDPQTLIFSNAPGESQSTYGNVYQPLTNYIASCTGKKTEFFTPQSSSAQVEAMRSGRSHIASYSTGTVGFAVNLAGAVPFVAVGNGKELAGYQLWVIVKADSPYQKVSDLKGKKIAHVSPSSNSGNLAPRAFFPELGLTPDVDYKPLMSGGHDRSVFGVASGDYDMAPVASDIFERMVASKAVDANQFRIIWKSETFPTLAMTYAYDLKPELQDKIRKCFADFQFPDSMKKEYPGTDRFMPITYKETWKPIRDVADKSGTPYNKTAYEAQQKRDAEAAAKKAAEEAAKKAAEQPKQ